MTLTIAFDREDDGRWIAEIVEIPNILPVYGDSREDAIRRVQTAAFYWFFWQLEEGKAAGRDLMTLQFQAA